MHCASGTSCQHRDCLPVRLHLQRKHESGVILWQQSWKHMSSAECAAQGARGAKDVESPGASSEISRSWTAQPAAAQHRSIKAFLCAGSERRRRR